MDECRSTIRPRTAPEFMSRSYFESGPAGRSTPPGSASNPEVFLDRRGNPKHGSGKLVLESRHSGIKLFVSLVDSYGIDEDPVLVPKIGNGCLPFVEICFIEDPIKVFGQQIGEISFHGSIFLVAI